MDKFEQYKENLQRDECIAVLKKEVAEIVSRKNLSSVMNDTKWIELQIAIDSLPFPPSFIMKCVTYDDDYPIGILSDAPRYLGDWSSYWEEGLAPFFNIEWIKVRPRYGKFRGRLIADEILDETNEFIAILEKLSIPYENEEGTILIYGYR